jgi:hypothetical protein
MNSTVDARLDLMARSLQEHIDLARELKLNLVAQLLTMTALEIRINQHRISPQEMDALCGCVDAQLAAHGSAESARVIHFPGRGRYS